MRRRLVVAALLAACPMVQAASVQTIFSAENALYGAGYAIGQADGWIDDSLLAAVRKYQADQPGLTVTGELDSQTLNALGVKGNSSQLMGGNVVSGPEAARKELGLVVASLSKPVKAPEPAAAPAPKPEPVVAKAPEPKAPTVKASAPEPKKPAKEIASQPAVVEKTVAKASKPEVKPEPVKKQPAPEPVSRKVAVAEPEPAPTSSNNEPTSEPIKLSVNVRTNDSTETQRTVAKVENLNGSSEVTEPAEPTVAMPEEPTPANIDQADLNAGTGQEAEPTERRGNVLTKMFDFLFGWMV